MAKSNFIVRGGADFSNINKSLVQTQKKFTAFQSGISKSLKIVTGVLGGIAIGKFIKDTTSMAMTVESSVDNISRNMGKSTKDFQNWINTQSKSLGIAKKDAYSYGSTFSNLLGSFQSSTKETADSTQELMKASAIIASKTGKTYDDVANRIRSGMLGSTEAIEDLGVYTNVSMIESTNAFKRFANGKSWAQLDFKIQQQIRLAAILEQTYARYGETLAETTQTKQARFLASLSNIKLNLGQSFLPIYNAVLPALTALGNILEAITSKIAVVSETFFGKSISIQTSGLEEGTDAVTDLGDAAETAGSKAKKAVAPFDELNQISSSSSNGGNGTTSGTTGDTISNPSSSITVTDKETGFTKWLEKIKDAIEPTEKALGRLKDALEPLGKLVFNNLKSFYNDTLVPIGKWILGEGLPRLLDVGAKLLNTISWDKLSDSLTNLNKALTPFAIAVGGGLISFIEVIGDIITPVVSASVDLFSKALNGLGTAINKIPTEVGVALGGAIGGIATALLIFNGATAVSGIVKTITTSMSGFFKLISAHPYVAIATALAGIAGALISLNKAKFNNSELGQYIKKLDSLRESASEFNKEVDTMLESHEQRRSDIVAEYGALEILSGKYFDLADKASLTNDEQLLLTTYAQELIEKVPELSSLIDEQTGSYKGTKDEIQQLITKTKEYYLVQAAQESLIDIAKKQYEAEKEVKGQLDAKTEAMEMLNEKQAEYSKLMDEERKKSTTDLIRGQSHTDQLVTLSKEIKALETAVDDMDISINTSRESQNKLNQEWDYATDYIIKYSDTGTAKINEIKTTVDNTDKTFKNANMLGKANGLIKDFNEGFKKDSSTNSVLKTWLGSAGNLISNFKLPNLKVGVDLDTSRLSGLSLRGQSGVVISEYATGGFPEAGELFIANEAGPELVGKMGSSNVVANNMQITEGIEQAAYSGFMRAIKDTGGLKASVRVEADTKGIFKAVATENDEYISRTGKNRFAY